jgi:outer membrane protein TolC
MNSLRKGFSTILIFTAICLPAVAQSPESTGIYDSVSYEQPDFLPPIQLFIDSALVYSPLVRYWQSESEIQDQETKRTRKSWADRLGVEADAKYGTIDNIYLNQATTGSGNLYNSTQTMRYNAGLSVKLPLSEFFNKKNSNQIAKLRYEQSMIKKEEIEQEVRRNVIVQYNKTILNQKVLKISGQSRENCFVDLKSAEIIYKKGNLSMTEFGRINENYMKAQIEYETAWEEFMTSLTLLQEISGIKIKPILQ